MLEYIAAVIAAILAVYIMQMTAKLADVLKSYIKIALIFYILGGLTMYALLTGDLIPFNGFAATVQGP